MTNQLVGLQLYTVRDETAKDFPITLHRVAEMGYAGVEFAGYGGISSKDMAAFLANLGLRALGSHVGLAALESDLDGELNYCLDIGCSFIILPWLSNEYRNADGMRQLAERLNEMGHHCHKRGITLVYHNHDFEFAQSQPSAESPKTYLLDTLLATTDPALVKLELDTYWAAYAGVDPIAYLHQHAGRVPFIHLKDMTPQRTFAEVGQGTLDIAGYCQAAAQSGTQFYIVENDQPIIPSLESARISRENLRKILR